MSLHEFSLINDIKINNKIKEFYPYPTYMKRKMTKYEEGYLQALEDIKDGKFSPEL